MLRSASSEPHGIKMHGQWLPNGELRRSCCLALAGVTQWIECWPVNQRVAGLIPSQGTCLGYLQKKEKEKASHRLRENIHNTYI